MSDQIEVSSAPEKTPEQLENEQLIKSFVQRYEKVRKPGISLQFLKSFLQDTAADKVRQDAQSSFGQLSTDRLAALIYVVQAQMEALAAENIRKLEEAQAAAEAERKAAIEAKAAATKTSSATVTNIKKGKKKQ